MIPICPAAYINFFKSLLLLHFLLDSFETKYRCNDCNKLPLELNYRSLFLTYKINYGSLFYHYKKTTVIAKKLWKFICHAF